MKKFKLLAKLISIISPIAFLVLGIVILALTNHNQASLDSIFLGVVLLLSGGTSIITYFALKRWKSKSFELAVGCILFALGFVFMFSNLDIKYLIFLWGLLEIIKSSFEIQINLKEIKDNKLSILNVILSIAEVVFGVLLCVHIEEGIKLHLIFLGISFIITAIDYELEGIFFALGKNKEEQQHE